MKKILVFGASSSKTSINKQLAVYVASKMKDIEVNAIDLNDFEMPIFSVDKEVEIAGQPEEAKHFKKYIREADAIIISFAEHNGSYSTAFKNVFDWASRVEKDMWQNKPMFLLATSPGKRGGASVLSLAVNDFKFRGGNVVASFSLPSFMDNFSKEDGVLELTLKTELENQLEIFTAALY